MKTMKTTFASIAAVGALAQLLTAGPAVAEEFYSIKNGQLERPTGYREWIYVGAPVTPNDLKRWQSRLSRVSQRLHRS